MCLSLSLSLCLSLSVCLSLSLSPPLPLLVPQHDAPSALTHSFPPLCDSVPSVEQNFSTLLILFLEPSAVLGRNDGCDDGSADLWASLLTGNVTAFSFAVPDCSGGGQEQGAFCAHIRIINNIDDRAHCQNSPSSVVQRNVSLWNRRCLIMWQSDTAERPRKPKVSEELEKVNVPNSEWAEETSVCEEGGNRNIKLCC